MKKKPVLCLLLTLFTIAVIGQSNSEKKSIVGTWTATTLSYGDYYSYDVKEDKIVAKDKLKIIMEGEEGRFGNDFFALIKTKASEYARTSSFTINGDGTYTLLLGGKRETGNYTFLPLYINPRPGSEESDVEYNLSNQGIMALIELNGKKSISIRKDGNELNFYTSNEAKGISYYDDNDFFAAGVHFKK